MAFVSLLYQLYSICFLNLLYRIKVSQTSKTKEFTPKELHSAYEPVKIKGYELCQSGSLVIALSTPLNIPIHSVYPGVSGCRTVPFKSLNHLFKPSFSDPEKGALTIMWINTVIPEKNSFVKRNRPGSLWTPNNFVPLVDLPTEHQPPLYSDI